MSAKRWLDHLDEQMQQLSEYPSLFAVMYDEEDPRWRADRWRSWPYIAVNMDLGPDGVCATNAMEYRWRMNFDRIGDFAYGVHND